MISRAKIKSVKLTLVIVTCYILCSTPFILGQLLESLWPAFFRPHLAKLEPLFWLMTLNSLANPWVYIWFNKNQLFFRRRSNDNSSSAM